jgi:hypothetical protein
VTEFLLTFLHNQFDDAFRLNAQPAFEQRHHCAHGSFFTKLVLTLIIALSLSHSRFQHQVVKCSTWTSLRPCVSHTQRLRATQRPDVDRSHCHRHGTADGTRSCTQTGSLRLNATRMDGLCLSTTAHSHRRHHRHRCHPLAGLSVVRLF